MITCNLCGGLGNQLFQIFTTIAYSIINKSQFFFENKHKLLNGSIIRNTYWNTLLNSLKPFLKINYANMTIIREQQFSFNNLPKCNPNDSIMLVGYFQSYKYFDKYKASIYKLLKIEYQKKELINKLNSSIHFDSCISMHFRLGDYKKYAHIYHLLDETYYMRALQIILTTANTDLRTVIYFCEDDSLEEVEIMIDKIKAKNKLIEFKRAPSTLDDWEQLLLMALCKCNIIANSTFSWWGAYLNTNDDNIVCVPKEWFNPQTNNDISDLYLEHWIKVII